MVNALILSLSHLANVGILILFLFLIFSIFAVQLWPGILTQQCFVPGKMSREGIY